MNYFGQKFVCSLAKVGCSGTGYSWRVIFQECVGTAGWPQDSSFDGPRLSKRGGANWCPCDRAEHFSRHFLNGLWVTCSFNVYLLMECFFFGICFWLGNNMHNSFSLKGAVAMLPQLLEISKASLFIMAGADFQLELRSLHDKTYGYRGATVHAANGFSFTILCYVASALKQRGRIPMLPTCLRGGYVVASISASKKLPEEALHQHLSSLWRLLYFS